MEAGGFFEQAIVYLAAAVIAVPVAKRLGLGSVLGYLLAGMLVGPFALGLVGAEGADVLQFAEFGVVLMLFLIGLELEPGRVWRMRAPIVGLGGLQVLLTAAVAGAVAFGSGLDWRASLAVGMTLALSSTAIVLQSLKEKGLLNTGGGQSAFSVLLFQDMAVIPILAMLPLLAVAAPATAAGNAHTTSWVTGLPPWAQTASVLGAVATIVLAGRFLVQPFFRAVARTGLREIFTAAALLLVIGTAVLMTRVGVSPALGTFLAGVVLARSEYRHELESDIEPFKGLLLGLFFVSVGAAIDFGLVASRPGDIVGLMAALIVGKLLVLLALGRLFKLSLDQNLLFGFSLAQGGEFAFVLLSFAVRYGVVTETLAGTCIAVVALSMAATPLLMLVNERFVLPRVGTREQTARPADQVDERNPVIVAGFGSFGSVVGRLLRANGVGTTVLEIDSDRVDLLRKLGLQVFYGDATRHDLLRAAGADEATLLILALDDPVKVREMVETARVHFPRLTILARASGRQDAYELIDSGIVNVFRDTLESSLQMGVRALRLLGFRAYQAQRAALTFRHHDELALRELAMMRHDQPQYLDTARRRIEDLEQMMLGDLADKSDHRDADWDTDSLRQEFATGSPRDGSTR
ncbi:MAG: monovalent cation:proton antiporter-2 (CPA2) family protein [Acidobacteria bacterium]|nr:monovalent cation:proton antiporter-2 (CPA2) family protein [Acidobacteriota bacterium]